MTLICNMRITNYHKNLTHLCFFFMIEGVKALNIVLAYSVYSVKGLKNLGCFLLLMSSFSFPFPSSLIISMSVLVWLLVPIQLATQSINHQGSILLLSAGEPVAMGPTQNADRDACLIMDPLTQGWL